MELGLAGKVVVVTGGASHIGRAIVRGFAAEGARIAIVDFDGDQARATAEMARATGAAMATALVADVTSASDIATATAAIDADFGAVDVLVNNAGWARPMYFAEQTPDYWRKLIDVNLMGAIAMTHAIAPGMVAARSGAIVFTSSDASFGEPRETVYGAAKGAINTFTKAFAREYGRYGIRANAVAPGVIIPEDAASLGKGSLWSASAQPFTPEQLEKVKAAIPLRRLGTPTDIANMVVFLSSSAAAHVSGQIVSVSGGYATPG
ncbi:3-oxoacyl-ACP reductase [Camelimonas fluminis]|uniref:SDR family NAD(P)-dependent oxidoreductase n=1 Tax=Camelimonas fluminis TaxID=1576911 RepID=A0ABV7UGT9_9HYPH|nr:SDR family NAD(P)-dependent oxidoreductase [Camelimonas fluminis]GHE72602.1 3-oxoacyl-ACP reductase [Camelimonas fluminis]